jgi:hypothetical protein
LVGYGNTIGIENMKIMKTKGGLFILAETKQSDEYILNNPDWKTYCGPGPKELPELKSRFALRTFDTRLFIGKTLTSVSKELWEAILNMAFRTLHIHNGQATYTGGIIIGPTLDIYLEKNVYGEIITGFGFRK